MANAVGTIRKIKDDFLNCGICLENLNKPKCLTCLHKFCEKCLEMYTRGVAVGKKFQCPYKCRDQTVLPKNRIQGLRTDFTLQGLIDYLKQREAEELMKQNVLKKERQRAPLPAVPQEGRTSAHYTGLDVEPSNDDLQNLYDALWKMGRESKQAPSSGKPYTNLESLFDEYDYVEGPKEEDTAPPIVPRRKAVLESEPPVIPPRSTDTIPPRSTGTQGMQRSSSEKARKGLYPALPKSLSLDSGERNTVPRRTPLRASAPEYSMFKSPPPVAPKPAPPNAAPPVPPPKPPHVTPPQLASPPPAYNPYFMSNLQQSQNAVSPGTGNQVTSGGHAHLNNVMGVLMEESLTEGQGQRGPKTFIEKMKEKFRIDLTKTVARSPNRAEPTQLQPSPTRIEPSPARVEPTVKSNPDDMTYEDQMILAKERSLQDKIMN